MKFVSVASVVPFLALTASAFPNPWGPPAWAKWGGPGGPPRPFGLSEANGKTIVTEFVSLLTNFNASVATNLLSAVSFEDTSDGINFLAGIPLGSVTFNSSQAFIYGQGTQPAIDVNVTSIDAVTPDGVITFRWIGHAGKKTAPLSGINVLYASSDPAQGGGGSKGVNGWVLTKVFSEFNSAEWVLQIGGTVTL
ncbi:hypothetical protein DV736_g624, partial [Chaetothyriales sp. CBS 134916]